MRKHGIEPGGLSHQELLDTLANDAEYKYLLDTKPLKDLVDYIKEMKERKVY